MTSHAKEFGRLNYENYPDGDRVISVGGQCLSRGLTLENLVVSYFYRNSAAYDTLLQMGRWFGYRIVTCNTSESGWQMNPYSGTA
jgi:hypothetical protein